jgi:DNA-directed RNA polymerase subunit L
MELAIQYEETPKTLTCYFENVDVSLINGLRRIILTEIDSLVIRGFPHKENLIQIKKNNTKFNNEYIKHRLSCLPILISKRETFKPFIQDYTLRIHVKNDTDEKMVLTTDDIQLYKKEVLVKKRLFYEDPIPICYMYPKISDNDPPEEFMAEIQLSIGRAKEDACWNMVSKCLFFNTENKEAVERKLKDIEPEKQTDFKLLDAQRLFIPNHFTMIVETVGVYTNTEIVYYACEKILETLDQLSRELVGESIQPYTPIMPLEGSIHLFEKTVSENDKMFILQLENDDYTFGKLIEKYLYNYKSEWFKFIAFKKEHPHDKHGLVQLVWKEMQDEDKLKRVVLDVFELIQSDVQRVKEVFKKNS